MRTGRPRTIALRPKSTQALRARIVLFCDQGMSNSEVARKLHLTGATVGKWRERFREFRLEGLLDEPRVPKDLRALSYQAKLHDLELPILSSVLPSNEKQVERGVKSVIESGNSRVGVLGFSFKAGTDDLRESPVIELIERLIGKGYDLRIYDRNVNLAALVGANRDFILNRIPHISRLMLPTADAVLAHAQTVVIGNNDPELQEIPSRLHEGQRLVDLVRISQRTGNDN